MLTTISRRASHSCQPQLRTKRVGFRILVREFWRKAREVAALVAVSRRASSCSILGPERSAGASGAVVSDLWHEEMDTLAIDSGQALRCSRCPQTGTKRLGICHSCACIILDP